MSEESEAITRYGKATAVQGQGPALAELLVKAAEANRGEPGCIQYEVNQLAGDPDVIWVTEKWSDREAIEASLADEDTKALIDEARPLIADMEVIELKPLGGIGAGPATPVPGYTLLSYDDIEDKAADFGLAEVNEARFGTGALDLRQSGFSHFRVKPGVRQPFGHHHHQAEEIHFILSGDGQVKLDDEIVDVKKDDVLRISPEVMRAFEAGPDGLEFVIVSQHFVKDIEMEQNWWTD
jgi:quinol monooxygenase YgiN/quercetin dioxygenase-like cupin family protein